MKSFQCWITFCLLVCLPNIHGSAINDLQEAHTLLQQTLNALKGTLDFFKREYKHVNLDAIIGTRIVDDVLQVLLNHIDDDFDAWPLDGGTIQTIRDVQALAEKISDKSIPYIAATDPPYYKRIGQLVQKNFWNLDFASKDFTPADLAKAWLPKDGESMREDESDNCLTELFGTGPNTDVKCHISSKCWGMMTKRGYSGYSLTHQVFYLQIAYSERCWQEMNKQRMLAGQPPPSEMVDTFCAAVYLEAEEIEKEKFPQLKQDLFMEQAALCGIMGYRGFFTADWLQKILEWQDKRTGCYKGDTIRENEVEFRNKRDTSNIRFKREERLLANGCLCHKTTVASGALVMYVRYIAEYMQMVFQRSQMSE